MNRYKELKYQGKIYTIQYQIDEILVKNKLSWLLDAEVENLRIEIDNNILIINSGLWYNGKFVYGVIRDIEWRYGEFVNGVWFGGSFLDGDFDNGIIYGGTFYNGRIFAGEIRSVFPNGMKCYSNFIDVDITPVVIKI